VAKQINESAAESLRAEREEILTHHRQKVPALLRKTLHSTSPIESRTGDARLLGLTGVRAAITTDETAR